MPSVLKMFSLEDKVAIVTGGAGLYGRHIVQALAQAGASVLVASRDKSQIGQLAAELRSFGLSVDSQPCDLTKEPDILRLRDFVIARFGKLDILFNNAVGRAGRGFSEMS